MALKRLKFAYGDRNPDPFGLIVTGALNP